MVLISADDYNDKKGEISDMEVKFYLHSKDTIWKGAMKVLSERTYKIIGAYRL